jgi:hypothetical protein
MKAWNHFVTVAASVFALGLADCAEQQPIDTPYLGPAVRIVVDPHVIVADDAAKLSDPLRGALRASHADMGAIALQEMKSAIEQDPRFHIVHHDEAVVLNLAVREYGFHSAAFTERMKVGLTVEARVDDRSGHTVYQAVYREWNSDATRRTMEQFFADPSALRAAFHDVAAAAAHDALAQMNQTALFSASAAAAVETPSAAIGVAVK